MTTTDHEFSFAAQAYVTRGLGQLTDHEREEKAFLKLEEKENQGQKRLQRRATLAIDQFVGLQ